jgi:hypothetical protein
VGLRRLACWDCVFESRRGHGCLPLVIFACCQVEFSATSRSLVQRNPIEWGGCLNVIVGPHRGGLGPQGTVEQWKKDFHGGEFDVFVLPERGAASMGD